MRKFAQLVAIALVYATMLSAQQVSVLGGFQTGGAVVIEPTAGGSTITGVSVACVSPITTVTTSVCTPTVTGAGGFSTAVTWSIASGTGSVDASGLFTPSGTGTSTVRATSVQDPSKSGTGTVVVNAGPSTITSVTASCVSPITTAGTSVCTPTVTGTGSFSTAVTWAVTSGAGSVNPSGVFTPAGTGLSTVTATSAQDPTKSGNDTVQVNPMSSTTCGTDGISTYPTLSTITSGCGNVAHTDVQPTSPTHLSGCNTNLTPNGHYVLDNDMGSSLTAECLGGAGSNEVDLLGHTITGWNYWNQSGLNSLSGLHIYNGTINCNTDTLQNGNPPACISVSDNGSTSWPVPLHFEYLTIHNSNTTASANPHTIMVGTSSNLGTPSGVNVIFNNNDSTPATSLSTSRITNFQVSSAGAWIHGYNNHTTCLSTATACQGFVAFGNYKIEYNNNWITNQQMATGTGDSPRGIICDTLASVGSIGVQCDIHDNIADTADGRAIRTRSARNAHIWNNVINGITPPVAGTSGTSAAIQLGNPDSGNDPGTTLVEFNELTLGSNNGSTAGSHVGGLPFLVADTSGTGWKLQHNSITCPVGLTCSNTPTWVNLRNVNGSGGQQLTVWTTTVTGAMSTPINNVEATGTLNLCLSGTASGSGTTNINNGICGTLP